MNATGPFLFMSKDFLFRTRGFALLFHPGVLRLVKGVAWYIVTCSGEASSSYIKYFAIALQRSQKKYFFDCVTIPV